MVLWSHIYAHLVLDLVCIENGKRASVTAASLVESLFGEVLY
jgi:hypothetical protein